MIAALENLLIGWRVFRRRPPAALHRLPYGPDPLQFGDLRLPPGAGPHPVAVVIHGGFWRAAYDLTHIGHLAGALTGLGWATWSIEYRRIGQQGGGWPGTFHDAGRGLDYLRELAPRYNLDLGRVVVGGHSAGGHLALWAAARPRLPPGSPLYQPDPLAVGRVVALAAVSDLEQCYRLGLSNGVVEEFLGGSPATVPERYAAASPAALLPLGVAQTLLHGTADPFVPFALSRDYAAAALAAGDPVHLVPLEDLEHFALIDAHSRAWPAVRAAFGQD